MSPTNGCVALHWRLRLLIIVCALASAGLLAGCGDDDAQEAADGATVAQTTPSTPGTDVPGGDPLSIEERLISDGLAGLAPVAGPFTLATAAEFAAQIGAENPAEETAALEAAGFTEGATHEYGRQGCDCFGVSGSVQFGSPEQAVQELQRLESESEADAADIREGSLPSVPGSRTLESTVSEGGQTVTVVEVYFTDGPFLYAEIAGAAGKQLDKQQLFADSTALYERVKGRPPS